MPRRQSTVRTRGLGAELREYRQNAGLTLKQVAAQLDWSYSTVSRSESGKRNLTSEDIASLLAVYNVTGEQRARLLGVAREADKPGWWETGRALGVTAALISFEQAAARITNYEPSLVPGLLQVSDYTRAIMRGAGITGEEAESAVATRIARQAILSREENAPEVLALIDEAALLRPVGGPRVMARQLRAILDAIERANVTVQVVPLSVGMHPGTAGAFVLLEFAKAHSVVHLEHKRSALFLEEPEDVDTFVSTVDTLRELALSPHESATLIADQLWGHEHDHEGDSGDGQVLAWRTVAEESS
jgi:transcriptional regulator with XRE-family HTH domain